MSHSSSCLAPPGLDGFVSTSPTYREAARRCSPARFGALVVAADPGLMILSALLSMLALHMISGGAWHVGDIALGPVPALITLAVLGRPDTGALAELRRTIRVHSSAQLAIPAGGAGLVLAAIATHHTAEDAMLGAAVWLFSSTALLLFRSVAARFFADRWSRNDYLRLCVALVGTPEETRMLAVQLPGAGAVPPVSIVGCYDDTVVNRIQPLGASAWPGGLGALLSLDHGSVPDAVLIGVPGSDADRLSRALSALGGLATTLCVAAPADAAGYGRARLGDLALGVVARPLSGWQTTQKDIFDRVGAFLLLMLALPFMAAIAVAIRCETAGPVLFRQQRTGLGNRPFTCLKFRTMHHRPPLEGQAAAFQQTVRGDHRVTRVGGWLRRTSLDECPQLLNVLRGDMSLVGPRPHAPNTTADGRLFQDIVTDYASRHRVRPGITGWAQVNGYRGETPDAASVVQRVQHDLFYVANWSMLLDLRILMRTALCVLHDPQAF